MSKDTGFDARDIEWNNKGYNKDVEWDKSKNQPLWGLYRGFKR